MRQRAPRLPRPQPPPQVLLESSYLAKEPAAARPVVYLAVIDESGGPEYHAAMAEVRTCAVVLSCPRVRLVVLCVISCHLASQFSLLLLLDLNRWIADGDGVHRRTLCL